MDLYIFFLLVVAFVSVTFFGATMRYDKQPRVFYVEPDADYGTVREQIKLSDIRLRYLRVLSGGLFVVCLGLIIHELTLPLEEQLAREQSRLEEAKEEAEARLAQEIKDAQTRVKLAKVRAEYAKLTTQAVPDSTELIQAKAELARLQAMPIDPSPRATPRMGSASPTTSQALGTGVDNQTRLILSALWLGACFFLQRVFEKLFKDKGYALLTVCAAGFLLAFFTANYFLLGGSVTGGVMGSVGERS